MLNLNFNHLRYFHAIALEGNLTRAAAYLNISQSAISIQLRKLEESLGFPLFARDHKSLELTEEGRIVLEYAKVIFQTGDEMQAVLSNRSGKYREVLRVGAVATLSRNFQLGFLKKALMLDTLEVVIQSASLRELVDALKSHSIDLILSNSPIKRARDTHLHSHLIAKQPISLLAPKGFWKKKRAFKFPDDLANTPMILPSLESNIRASFDLILEGSGIHPLIASEADDMAMLRLIAREVNAVSLLPPVVVQDELKEGILIELCKIKEIEETFYAITASRKFRNTALEDLLKEQNIKNSI